jgi:hypothetical protein
VMQSLFGEIRHKLNQTLARGFKSQPHFGFVNWLNIPLSRTGVYFLLSHWGEKS